MEEINETPVVFKVKDMDADDQPRERALKYGIHTLSTADLWALILRTGLPGNPITKICRELMRDNGNSLFTLERKTLKEIMKSKGIGQTKGLQVLAVMELTRRYNREKPVERDIISSSQSIYNLMRSDIANLPHEEIWTIFLGRRNDVICRKRITSGSATASIFDIKAIMKEALLIDAQGLVLCHNHPSGTLVPSGPDDQITRKLKEGAALMDIRFLDHLILSPAGFYSYHDSGRL